MRFIDFVAEPSIRKSTTDIFAATVRAAHGQSERAWSLSQPTGKPRINLVVGRIFVLSLGSDALLVTVDLDQLDQSARNSLADLSIDGPKYDFASVPSAKSYLIELSNLESAWPLLAEAHHTAVVTAANTVSRTPYFKSYAPDLLDDLESEVGSDLPRPDYGIATGLTSARVDSLVAFVERTYPGWQSFDDPRFEEDEVHYKQEVVETAAELLSREALSALLETGDHDEFLSRLEKIGKQTNLLWMSVPSASDLNILYSEDLPLASFCRAIFDLIHGDGDGAERLTRYLAWVAENDIPRSHSKWTFPTYLLFFCNPHEEMFVKPSYVRAFIELGGFDFTLGSGPSGDTYAAIRAAYEELGDKLEAYSPRDMVDLQSFVWVAVRASKEAAKQREQIEAAREEFKRLQNDLEFQFRVKVRHYRSEQLQSLLSDPDMVTLETFDREVWPLVRTAAIKNEDVKHLFRKFGVEAAELKRLIAGIDSGDLHLQGNMVWGSGTQVYGPMLRLRYEPGTPSGAIVETLEAVGDGLTPAELLARAVNIEGGASLTEADIATIVGSLSPYLQESDGRIRRVPDERVRERYVKDAVRILNDSSLDPAGKATSLMEIPGFGRNAATGLVMVFHPEEYGIYNTPSRNALESLGLEAKNLASFEASLAQLKEQLEAADFFELDKFLWMLDSGIIDPHRSGLWWVNQGKTYEDELATGCVWAGMAGDGAPRVQHHIDVSRMIPGDHVIHYAGGEIRAVGTVTDVPSERPKDSSGDAGAANPTGYFAPVEYAELNEPIALDSVPEAWRKDEGGPFNKNGGVKQGYLYPLTTEFAGKLGDRFPELAHLMPATDQRRWLFQANPQLYDLRTELLTVTPGDDSEWYVSRYGDEMKEGDYVYLWQAGEQAGVYATGRISGAVFERATGAWGKDDGDGTEGAIPFAYERVLERPIPRAEMVDDSDLSGMQVIKEPEETNFKVTSAEHRRLQELIDGGGPVDFEEIVRRVQREGMRISEDMLRRYHLALQTRGFVILAGLSGSGKTWLTQLYAEATGAHFKLVPVAPNWTTNEDLLGYFNPITQAYHDTPFSRFLRDAADEYQRATKAGEDPALYHVTLDEMNLARVEYYFARFLSAMEVRARRQTATIELGPEDTVTLPPNLYFIGTVNIDETTHGFADKVYDRAQLIELDAPRALLKDHLGDFKHAQTLLEIYDAVAPVAPFAFRVLDEIEAYVGAAEEFGIPWLTALDEQVVQKVLPKLKGADPRIGEALEAVIEVARDALPLTASKAESMSDALKKYGFTSYF